MRKSTILAAVSALAAVLVLSGCGGKDTSKTPAVDAQAETAPDTAAAAREAVYTNIEMVFVEGGTFTMGCTEEQGDECEDDEKPAHNVTVSSFYLGKYEVTNGLWRSVMGHTKNLYKSILPPIYEYDESDWDDNTAVFNSGYEMYKEFIRKLNAKTGKAYRLPTEAEWEYAARGGNKSKGYKYSGGNNIDVVAWYGDHLGGGNFVEDDKGNHDKGNHGGKCPHTVGTKAPNELGIYDMSGNIQEFVEGYYEYYDSEQSGRSYIAEWSEYNMTRGGSCNDAATRCRVSCRYGSYDPEKTVLDWGFRLAHDADKEAQK